ncbi:MAG: hypothetical protein JO242_28540 [Streptosporangiaceae bacterium]|nr:hypothetical protein [Streptosporangiaceae bacterium]
MRVRSRIAAQRAAWTAGDDQPLRRAGQGRKLRMAVHWLLASARRKGAISPVHPTRVTQ